jgi:cytochrome c7-like protein
VAQIFSRRFTLVLRLLALGLIVTFVLAVVTYRVNVRSDAPENAAVEQPVPFSHKHHVSDDGIDCRYCHVSVETSRFAGIPPLSTCMTCHSQLFTEQPVLAPLLAAYKQGESGVALQWNRVHDLPDFVYFDHSIHVNKGVGCSTCHGRVDQMPLTARVVSLDMQWCLDCHRAPERYLRPRDRILDMAWQPPPDQAREGARLAQAYHIRSVRHLEMCSTCHR